MRTRKSILGTLTKQIVVSSSYAISLFVATGLPQTVFAASCNDLVPGTSIKYADALVHFVYDGSKTFAIAKSAATGSLDLPDAFFAFSSGIDRAYQYNGTDTSSLKLLVNGGKYGAARPVSIESKAKQDFITKEFLQFLGPADSAKSTYIDAWKEYGTSQPFTDMSGVALHYTNWPVGAAPKTSLISSPQAVTMGSDGVWKHGENAQRISQIVEFAGKLDCALDLTTISSGGLPPPQEPPATPGANGELMCAKDLNQDGDIAVEEAASCIQTEQGALCPIESVDCVRPEGAPTCVPGTVFDNVSNKCVQITSPECQSGTYDSNTGKCYEKVFPLQCLRIEGNWCVVADITSHDICGKGEIICDDFGCSNSFVECETIDISKYAVPAYVGWESNSSREVINFSIPKFIGNWALSWSAPDDALVNIYKAGVLYYSINSSRGSSNSHSGTNNDETLTGIVTGDNADGIPTFVLKVEGTNAYSDPTCLPNLNLTYDPASRKCVTSPRCADGSSYDAEAKKCIGTYGCPLGSDFACMESGGKYQCSPNSCFEQTAPPGGEEEAILDESMLQDDARNSDGSCAGQIMIFTGKPSRCRPPGLKVGYVNDCCESDQMLSEDVGNTTQTAVSAIQTMYEIGQVAYYGNALVTGAAEISAISTSATGAVTSMTVVSTATGATTTLSGAAATGAYASLASGATGASAIGAGVQAYAAALLNPTTIIIAVAVMVAMKVIMGNGCDQTDIQTGGQVESKQCHYVGSYCEKKWPLVGCVQKAKGYCCFNSMMGRIIHEQGRPQLTTFAPDGAWGSPESPNCRGFVPGEFESLDFAKIDMREYFSELQKDMAVKIQNAQEKINATIQQRNQQIQNHQ